MNPRGYTNLFGTRAALPPRYFGNIAYYLAVAAHGGDTYMDGSILFDKRQKVVHRCEIADTRGRVQLTAPVAKPHGISRATWDDVAVSPHGQWWHIHLTTLESAYGRTPFLSSISTGCARSYSQTHICATLRLRRSTAPSTPNCGASFSFLRLRSQKTQPTQPKRSA